MNSSSTILLAFVGFSMGVMMNASFTVRFALPAFSISEETSSAVSTVRFLLRAFSI